MKPNRHIGRIQQLGLRPEDVAEVLGSVQLFRVMVDKGWLRPVIQRHKLTLFDAGDVAKAWCRILNGEDPFP